MQILTNLLFCTLMHQKKGWKPFYKKNMMALKRLLHMAAGVCAKQKGIIQPIIGVGILRKFKLIQVFIVVLLICNNEEDPLKVKA